MLDVVSATNRTGLFINRKGWLVWMCGKWKTTSCWL